MPHRLASGRSHSGSTGCNRPPAPKYSSRIHVTIMRSATARTRPRPDTQRQSLEQVPAPRAGFDDGYQRSIATTKRPYHFVLYSSIDRQLRASGIEIARSIPGSTKTKCTAGVVVAIDRWYRRRRPARVAGTCSTIAAGCPVVDVSGLWRYA